MRCLTTLDDLLVRMGRAFSQHASRHLNRATFPGGAAEYGLECRAIKTFRQNCHVDKDFDLSGFEIGELLFTVRRCSHDGAGNVRGQQTRFKFVALFASMKNTSDWPQRCGSAMSSSATERGEYSGIVKW